MALEETGAPEKPAAGVCENSGATRAASILPIVYATDAAYLSAVEVSLSSAVAMASEARQLRFHILDCGIPDEAWAAFAARHPGVQRHQMQMADFAGFRLWHGSLGTYARLRIPVLLAEARWCLYVDGDTLFTDDPLKLFETIAAFEAHGADEVVALAGHTTSFTSQPAWYAAHGLPLHRERYVCAGVILMNLDYFRAHGVSERCMDFIRQHPDAPFPDQDALNVICQGHVALLPDAWGDYSGAAFGKATRPGCVHYVGELPWKLAWMWHLGYSDAVKVWVACAEGTLGMSRREAMGMGALQWGMGRLYNRLVRLAVAPFRWSGAFRRRFPNFQNRFIAPAWRGMMQARFWQQAWMDRA